jgi:hypothetical protein
MDGYRLLAFSIITQAIQDYAEALEKAANIEKEKKEVAMSKTNLKLISKLLSLETTFQQNQFIHNGELSAGQKASIKRYLYLTHAERTQTKIIQECRTFFLSSLCELMTGFDGEEMLRKVDKKIRDKKVDFGGYDKRRATEVKIVRITEDAPIEIIDSYTIARDFLVGDKEYS